MITILVDHDIEGRAALLWQTFVAAGWQVLTGFQLVTLREVGLPEDSPDRVVWQWAQAQRMLLMTGNRNMDGPDSLEQTIRDQSHPDALPVLTIASVDRLVEAAYRDRCAERLAELGLYLESYLGAGRLFIP